MYCNTCRRAVAGEGLYRCPTCGGGLAPDVTVALRPRGVLQKGDMGVLDLLVRNEGELVEDVRVELETKLFEDVARARTRALPRGRAWEAPLPVGKVREAGTDAARLVLSYRERDGGPRVAFVGRPVIQTSSPDGGNYVINITGSKLLGVELSQGKAGADAGESPWSVVDLGWDESLSRRLQARETTEHIACCPYCGQVVERDFVGCPACGMDLPSFLRAMPRVAGALSDTQLPPRVFLVVTGVRFPVRLLTTPEVTMGRLPGNDVSLLVPATSPYHEYAPVISRVAHCQLRIENEVPVLSFKYPLHTPEGRVSSLPVREDMEVTVGRGHGPLENREIVRLQCMPRFVDGAEGRICLGVGLVPWFLDAGGLRPGGMNLVLYRHLDLAHDRSFGLVPAGPGRSPLLRVILYGGELWLEPLAPRMPLEIAGEIPVPVGEVAPLRHGSRVHCGPVSFAVHVPE